jgi:hypothetical protein
MMSVTIISVSILHQYLILDRAEELTRSPNTEGHSAVEGDKLGHLLGLFEGYKDDLVGEEEVEVAVVAEHELNHFFDATNSRYALH